MEIFLILDDKIEAFNCELFIHANQKIKFNYAILFVAKSYLFPAYLGIYFICNALMFLFSLCVNFDIFLQPNFLYWFPCFYCRDGLIV